MPLTPSSGNTTYMSVSDVLSFKDVRMVGDLVRDDGTRATPLELQTDSNLSACMMAACGELEASLLAGNRYQPSDLLSLNGNSLSFLKSILSDETEYKLYSRRGISPPEYVKTSHETFTKTLDAIRNGAKILAFQETQQAGLPKDEFMTFNDMLNTNMVTNYTRFWGVRAGKKRSTH